MPISTASRVVILGGTTGSAGPPRRQQQAHPSWYHFAYTAAGPLVATSLAEYTKDKGRAFFELRVIAALEAIRLAVPHILPGGSITMTSGTAAFRGSADWILGSAASGAIISAARALAVELTPIRVNVVGGTVLV